MYFHEGLQPAYFFASSKKATMTSKHALEILSFVQSLFPNHQ